MTAITINPGINALVSPARTHRSDPRPATPRGCRASRATYRRRRLLAAALVLVAAVVMGEAGVALGGTPLAPPERRPSHLPATSSSVVLVRPGDTLWSIVERNRPGTDPRPIVDQLSAARHGTPLEPGETIELPAA
jgi:hypothetical protein